MVQKVNQGKKVFYVQSGSWEGVTTAEGRIEACSIVLQEALEKFKENTDLSCSLMSVDISSIGNQGECGEIKIHATSEILANVGLYKKATSLSELCSHHV